MNVNQEVRLNLSADGIPPRLFMPQGDANSRTIIATLWDGAAPYNVPASAAVMVRFRKPDGTGGLYDATEAGTAVTASGNTVTAPVATQMLAVAGVVQAEIDIYGTGSGKAADRLATFRFAVEVAPSVYPDAQIISSDYFSLIAATISEAIEAAAKAELAKNAAQAAQSAAETAQSGAESAEQGAQAAQAATENAKTAAQAAQSAAENAKTAAQTAQQGAEAAQSGAESAEQGAQAAQAAAENAKTAAQTAQQGAKAAQDAAEDAQAAAASSAAAAAASAANAATSVEGAVKYNTPQSLTDAQKQQARDNINAPAPYEAGDNISITGRIITTKAFPCNPNLLDNEIFQVWQRYPNGTYTGVPDMTYIADRWMFQSSDGSATNKITKAGNYGIKNASGPNVRVHQRLENAAQYNGRLLTLSVLKGDGSLSYHTGVASGWTETTDIFGVFAPQLAWIFTGETWLAAKLELGSQQTLAHQENGVWVLNEIPDYGEQLRRCQRYCFVWWYGLKQTGCLTVMQCAQPGLLFGLIPTPVTMRNNPVLTGGSLTTFAGRVTLLDNFITCANGIRAVAHIEGTSTSQGQAVGIENADDNGRVIFSADL